MESLTHILVCVLTIIAAGPDPEDDGTIGGVSAGTASLRAEEDGSTMNDGSTKDGSVDEVDGPLERGLLEDSFVGDGTWQAALEASIEARTNKDPEDATENEKKAFLSFALVIVPKILLE